MFVKIDNINCELFQKNMTLDLAEEFIKSSGMQDEWEDELRESMPSDE